MQEIWDRVADSFASHLGEMGAGLVFMAGFFCLAGLFVLGEKIWNHFRPGPPSA